MLKFVSLYTHTNTDACLGSFLSVVWIVYCRFETLFFLNMYTSSGHLHKYRRGCYYSSGVGLTLLVRLEKSLITKGPHRYVWSETRHVSIWTWSGGPCEDSSKPRCFWRIFTLWQWYFSYASWHVFDTKEKPGGNPACISTNHWTKQMANTRLKLQLHFLVQYNGVFTTAKLNLSRVLEK